MNKKLNAIIVILLIIAVAVVIAVKQSNKAIQPPEINQPTGEMKKLPRLVDLGADKCIPCKMMAPILEELKKDYAGIVNVEFIDVWKNPDKAKEYGISIIPTQIFFDSAGKELFRHEGFFSKEDILGKWKEFGVELVKIK
ncbi:MAG: thioredoxin family protein [Phycisphaerae bacterium]|jgi:thioredoxin 1